MPFPDSPPPSNEAGAIIQPRQLQRWLDVNPIHALTRIQSYITLPVFSVETQWKGYSEIVAVFNYTSTKNFSLKSFSEILNPNYVACIMWVDEDYNVYRYKLWSGVGEVFFFDVDLYEDQLIKSNFRIEIWNVAPTSFLTFFLDGANVPQVNQAYTYDDASTWLGSDVGGTDVLESITPAKWIVQDDTNDIFYELFDVDLFPFGIWTVGADGTAPSPFAYVETTVSQVSALTFYTSALGNYDYRYADDFSLAETPTIVTGLSVNLPSNLPINWPADSYPTLN